MKKLAGCGCLVLALLLGLLVWFGWRWWRGHEQEPGPGPTQVACRDRAELQVAFWRKEGMAAPEIERRLQAELAKCNGMSGPCVNLAGAANADYAWLGRQLLSGSLSPASYLAAVRDRSGKMRQMRRDPSVCDAFSRGDADGDLVPNDRDTCPNTPPFAPTDATGCPTTAPLPPAPDAAAVKRAADAYRVAIGPECRNAPVPDRPSILKVGSDPGTPNAFLIAVSPVQNQPPKCAVFYELDVSIYNSSFFAGQSNRAGFHRLFTASKAVTVPNGVGLVFRIREGDAGIPWAHLIRTAIEPSDRADKTFRVRSVNAAGISAGWSAPYLYQRRPLNAAFR